MIQLKALILMMSLVAVLLITPQIGLTQDLNTLTKREKKEGWKLLFNGEDLHGWHIYLKPDAAPGWSVENGTIRTDFHNGGERQDLVTDEVFKDYELQLQWKIAKGGNSGIIFNVHEDKKYEATFFTGLEMQVLDNKDASDNKIDSHLAGSLYDLISADPAFVHPAEEWNTVKIRLVRGHLTFWMNGHQVVETQLWDQQWKELVAHSKFKQWPTFGTYKEGRIALQYHGGAVWYRNIKIRRL